MTTQFAWLRCRPLLTCLPLFTLTSAVAACGDTGDSEPTTESPVELTVPSGAAPPAPGVTDPVGNPAAPAEPGSGGPVDPAPPTNPVDPVAPGAPDPSNTVEPEPSPGKPTEPADSVEPVGPTTPTAPEDPAPEGSVDPVDPAPVDPVDAVAPVDPVEPVGPVAPVDSVCPANPGTAPSGEIASAELAVQVSDIDPMDYNFHLFEGPTWVDAALFFSDIDTAQFHSNIYRYDPGSGMTTLFMDDAGTNGLAVGTDGTLYSATPAKKEISKYDLGAMTQQQVVGGELNSPNDMTIASDGTIFFSDPQQGELPAGGAPQVVHIFKDGKDSVFVGADQVSSPNGVLLSMDEKSLFVTGGMSYIKRIEINPDGAAGEVGDFATNLSTPDGITKDCLGNVYVAEHNAQLVRVLSPEGTSIATIPLGEANNQGARPTNVAFGGADRTMLFITAAYSLWKVQLSVAGYPN